MIKLIALDVDGTIVRHGHISKPVIRSLKMAQAKGITVTLATGRNTKLTRRIAKKLGLNDGKTPIIGLNGAEVFTFDKKGKASHIFQKTFTKKLTQEIIKKAHKNKVSLYAYTTSDKVAFKTGKNLFFLTFMELRTRLIAHIIKKDLSNIDKYSIIKFLAFGRKEKVKNFKDELKAHNFSEYSWSFQNSRKGNIEVNMPGINKVDALQFVCEKLKIKQNEVVYFGDGENDIKALEWAGRGVVMRNAKSEVKLHANDLALSVKDNGVADWINKNVK